MCTQDKVSEQFSIRNDKFRDLHRPASVVKSGQLSVWEMKND